MIKNLIYQIKKVYEELLNKLKSMFGKAKYKHVKKQSKLDKDVVLGTVHKLSRKHLIVGVKVITHKGIASITKLCPSNWVNVSYGSGKGGSHKAGDLFQYFVEVQDIHNDTVKLLPLSYADYEFIHPKEAEDLWIEGHITKKNYFQLTDQEKEDRAHLPIFNKSWEGPHILIKLEEENINLKLKARKLVTIKK